MGNLVERGTPSAGSDLRTYDPPASDMGRRDAFVERLRARAARPLGALAAVAWAALIVLIVWLVAARLGYNASEHYENLDRVPIITEALPVGDDATIVFYQNGSVSNYNIDFPLQTKKFFVFLDAEGRFIGPSVPYEEIIQSRYGMVPERTLYDATGSGLLVLAWLNATGGDELLMCLMFDPVGGGVVYDSPVLPVIDVGRYALTVIFDEPYVHVLARLKKTSPGGEGLPVVVHARSLEWGRTWERSTKLLFDDVAVSDADIVRNGPFVNILLTDYRNASDPAGSGKLMVVRSYDGGESFSAPEPVGDSRISMSSTHYSATLEVNGSMLVLTTTNIGSETHRHLYLAHPSGAMDELALPVLEGLVSMSLSSDYTDLGTQWEGRILCSCREENGLREYVLDIEGNVRSSKLRPWSSFQLPREVFCLRDFANRSQAVMSVRVHYGSFMNDRYAYEIHLVEEDRETGARTLIGRPYEVVWEHTPSEEDSYVSGARFRTTAAWWVLGLASVVNTAWVLLVGRSGDERAGTRRLPFVMVAGIGPIALLVLLVVSEWGFRGYDWNPAARSGAILGGSLGVYLLVSLSHGPGRWRYILAMAPAFMVYALIGAIAFALAEFSRGGWYDDQIAIWKWGLWPPTVGLVVLLMVRIRGARYSWPLGQMAVVTMLMVILLVLSLIMPFLTNRTWYYM